jgi:hypothetical protein
MGVLKKFEQRLEGLVNGTFAKVFKSEVQPVEIAGALQRECDNNAQIWNRDRTIVPNDFVVELSPHDHERLSPYEVQLGQELAGMVREYAQAQRYSFMGPLQVHLQRADDLDTGLYRVRSRTQAAGDVAAQPTPAPAYQQPPAPARDVYPAAPPMPSAPPPMPVAAPAPTQGAAPGAGVHQFPGTAPAGSAARCWLEVNGARHPLNGPAVVLGRSTEADIRIDDPGVSRKHAEVRVGTPSLVLDLGSTNGIVVDGRHTQRATLRDGSRIVVGSTTIVYRQAEG